MRKFSDTTKEDILGFSKAGAIFFPIVFGILIPLTFKFPFKPWPFIVGAVFLVFRFIPYSIVNIIYYPWIIIAHFIGSINQVIILSLVFYLVVTPIGILKRIFSKDPMRRKIEPNKNSYRIESDKLSDMKFPF